MTGYRRVERGEQCAVTLRSALQRGAWLQLPCPSRPWGAWPPPLRPPPSLSTPTPSAPQSIACTPPYKRAAAAHASPCNRVVQGWKRGATFGKTESRTKGAKYYTRKSMCTWNCFRTTDSYFFLGLDTTILPVLIFMLINTTISCIGKQKTGTFK